MRFTFSSRTYYAIGIVSAALNFLGSILVASKIGAAAVVFQLATLAAGIMMLLLGATQKQRPLRLYALFAVALLIMGLMPSAVGLICAALAWPVFAVPYFSLSQPQSLLRTAVNLVFLTGAIQLVGSFLPLMEVLRIFFAIFIAVSQGVLAWVLFRAQPNDTDCA